MSYIPSPIIIPQHSNDEERCPKCGREEDVKIVCRHCGYEYPEEDNNLGLLGGVIVAFILILFAWFCVTMITWLFIPGDSPLLEVLTNQWKWLISKRLW